VATITCRKYSLFAECDSLTSLALTPAEEERQAFTAESVQAVLALGSLRTYTRTTIEEELGFGAETSWLPDRLRQVTTLPSGEEVEEIWSEDGVCLRDEGEDDWTCVAGPSPPDFRAELVSILLFQPTGEDFTVTSAEITYQTPTISRSRRDLVSRETYRLYRMTEASATRSCTYELWMDQDTYRPFRLRVSSEGEAPCRHNPLMVTPQVDFDDFNEVATIRVPEELENAEREAGARGQPGEALRGRASPLLGVRHAVVYTAGGYRLRLRSRPNFSLPAEALLADGTVVELRGGPRQVDDFTWWKVRTEEGTVGWVVASADGLDTLLTLTDQ
jgi:hypothetical protein